MTPIKILIADDHPVFRFGLKALIATEPDLEVVGEAATGKDAVVPAFDGQLGGRGFPDGQAGLVVADGRDGSGKADQGGEMLANHDFRGFGRVQFPGHNATHRQDGGTFPDAGQRLQVRHQSGWRLYPQGGGSRWGAEGAGDSASQLHHGFREPAGQDEGGHDERAGRHPATEDESLDESGNGSADG